MMSNLETSMIRQVLTGDGNVELLQQSRVVFVRVYIQDRFVFVQPGLMVRFEGLRAGLALALHFASSFLVCGVDTSPSGC